MANQYRNNCKRARAEKKSRWNLGKAKGNREHAQEPYTAGGSCQGHEDKLRWYKEAWKQKNCWWEALLFMSFTAHRKTYQNMS